jgi:Zn-dependent protease with chaperone function
VTTTPYRLRVDEQAIGAATTVRFVLLIALLLVSSATMIVDVMGWLGGAFYDFGGLGCALAAGADPIHSSELTVWSQTQAQLSAFDACNARYAAFTPWWAPLGWPILVLAVAATLFWGLPAWKRRRGRVVPLADVDHDGAISADLARLVTSVARLDRIPSFVVDPAAASTGAVVFGSNRRPTICLHGGLLIRRTTEPKVFQAIVLHELAHVRNRDVTITYLTVTVWRAFLALVLLPYLVWAIASFAADRRPFNDSSVVMPLLTKGVLLAALTVALTYLARSDVLRSREIYADLAAVGWGADRHGWAVSMPPRDCGAVRRVGRSFVELWRTHPRWELRRTSLTDPAMLFGVQALPMFLTGVTAVLIDAAATNYLRQYIRYIPWVAAVIAVGAAALVTSVGGVALWRAATHSVLTGRPAPSGVRAGLWLGVGLATADLVTNQLTSWQWLPGRPQVLLLVIGAGVVFAWWSTQCAHLWLRAWPGRSVRPAILLGLAGGCLVLAGWFEWWDDSGSAYENGLFGQLFTELAAGPGGYRTALAALLSDQASGLLILPAVTAVWVVPLLVWALGQAAAIPRWSRVGRRGTGDTVAPVSGAPPLRRVLLAALLGGVFGWLVLAGVMARLHVTQPPSIAANTNRAYAVYLLWVLVAWIAGMALAAAIASAVTSRYGLLAALIAAGAAGFVCFAGMFSLAALQGCVPPVATLWGSCAWRPRMVWPVFSYWAGTVFVFSPVTAIGVALVAAAAQRLRGAGTRPTAGGSVLSARPRDRIVRRVGATALGVLTVGLAVVTELSQPSDTSTSPPAGSSVDLVDEPVSAQTRAFQVLAWKYHGGNDLLNRFFATGSGFFALLERSGPHVDGSLLHGFCADFDQIARDSDAYFQVPDPQTQPLWRSFIAQTRTIGQDCAQAVAQSSTALLTRTTNELIPAGTTGNAVRARILATARAGGD